MAKPIKITITGADASGTDAPTVDDFLGQVKDFLDILRSVERAVSDDKENEIIWRVTNAQMNSPIWVEVTPFAKNPAIFVDNRAEQVELATRDGIVAFANGDQRPRYFNDDVIGKTRKIYSRVTNGLLDTSFQFDGSISANPLVIDGTTARRVETNFLALKADGATPYRELGSIEGFISKAELDGFGRAILRFRSRIDDVEIKAVATGHAFQQIESLRLSDVWQGIRVRVYGMISYKARGVVEGIQTTGIELLDQSPLPGIDDILDENFSGDLVSEAYLENLRNG